MKSSWTSWKMGCSLVATGMLFSCAQGAELTGVPSNPSGFGGASNNGGSGIGTGGAAALGGALAQGGSLGQGGNTSVSQGGSSGTASGGTSASGASGAAGKGNVGGSTSVGGAKATGGAVATGGAKATGGVAAIGGTTPTTGGSVATGGTEAMGGGVAVGGAVTATGGTSAAAGTASVGGVSATGGSTAVSNGLRVELQNCRTTCAPADQSAIVLFRLVNGGSAAVPLAGVTVRYYFKDANINTARIDYQTPTGVTSSIVAMTTPTASADHYALYTFSTGSLAAGAAARVDSDVHDGATWKLMDETDDYSYEGTTAYTTTEKMTVYQGTTLVWGTEP